MSSSTSIERSGHEQQQFANMLMQFESDLRSCCRAMKSHISDARDNVQADNARDVLDYLEQLIEDIEGEAPAILEFGTLQKRYGGFVEEAEEFRFSKR